MTPVEGSSEMDNHSLQPTTGESGQVKRGKKRKRSVRNSPQAVNNCDNDVYEVEKILNHQEANGKVTSYFVKWQGWPPETSTWEPIENLKGCLETVVDYFESSLRETVRWESQVYSFKKWINDFTDDDIDKLANMYLRSEGDIIPPIVEEEHEQFLKLVSRLPRQARDQKLIKEVRNQCMILELKKRRTLQLQNLRDWEREINEISTDTAHVYVINCVDLETRPMDFKYINKYKQSLGLQIPEDPPIGCECNSHCNKVCYCVQQGYGGSAYNSKGLLQVPKGSPIYECNSKCKCGPDCPNRVLQNGRKVDVSIFKTNNGCGWGIRTLQKIAKGQFVTEYVGEVITTEEADRRGKQYDREGRTYLFDLDFNDNKDFPYTVDAAEYGNISHFINHSCSPNLEVYAVWVECLDPNIPRLGLYSNRVINPYEELTFDYLCQPVEKSDKRGKSSSSTDVRTLCKCNAPNCRTFLF